MNLKILKIKQYFKKKSKENNNSMQHLTSYELFKNQHTFKKLKLVLFSPKEEWTASLRVSGKPSRHFGRCHLLLHSSSQPEALVNVLFRDSLWYKKTSLSCHLRTRTRLKKKMCALPTECGYVLGMPLTAALALKLSRGGSLCMFSTYPPDPSPKGYTGVPGQNFALGCKRLLLGSKRRSWKQGK